MNHRRTLLTTSVVAIPALALAACGAQSGGAPSTVSATVEQVIARIQAAISFSSALSPMLAIVAPGAASFIPQINAGLNTASNIFNTISTTMTEIQAQPIVGQVATALGGALTAAQQATAVIGDATARAKAQGVVATAQAVLPLLTAFATGVQAAVSAAPLAAGATLRVRSVR